MKTKSLKQILMLLFGSVIMLSACDNTPEPTEDPVIPNFPELGEIVVAAGETKTFKFDVNSDWKISLPLDQAGKWFKIKSGEQTDFFIEGVKGEVELTIVVAEEEEFDDTRTCDIVMAMGGTDKVIGVLTRGTLDREFSFSVARYDAENDVILEDEEYIEVEGEEPIDLYYPAIKVNYMTFVKVLANFDWVIADLPEWLEPKGTDGILYAGQKGVLKSFRFEAVEDKLPLEDATGTIVFADKNNSERKFEYEVKIPGVKDFVRVANMPDEVIFSPDALFFNKKTELYQAGMGSDILLRSTKEGASVYVASESGSLADWVTVDLEAWNDASNAVIQARSMKLSTTYNVGNTVRKATVLVYPTSLVSNPAELFNGADVKDEYKKYIVTNLTQEFLISYEDELVTAFRNNEELMKDGAVFSGEMPYYITGMVVTLTTTQKSYPGSTPYQVVVNNREAMDLATLRVGVADFSIEYLVDFNNGLSTSGPESVNNVYVEKDGTAITIKTDSKDKVTDYILLKDNSNNTVFAVIEFIYDPETKLLRYDYSNPATAWLAEPEAAAAAGFTFAPAVPGLANGEPGARGYQRVSGQKFQAPMYEVMQTVKYIDEENQISPKVKIEVSRPYASIEYWSATSGAVISRPNDGQNSESVWINYNRETGEVYMKQVIKDKTKVNQYNEQDGAILFKDEDGNIFLVVCCYMRFVNPVWLAAQPK